MGDFVPVAKKMAGIPEEEGVLLYEEVKPLRIDSLDEKKTLKQAELITGDVIIVENYVPEEERARFDNPHVSQFFSNIVNRVEIQFRKMDSPEEDAFTLVLNKTMEYMEVAKRVGERIGVPGDRVRLFSQSKANRLASIKTKVTLEAMTKSSQPSFTLYFLEMDMTIEEYSKLQHRVVQFWQGARRYSSEELLMPEEATFEDLVAALKKQVNLKGSKEIRMYISKDGYLEDYAPMKTELSRAGHSYTIVAEEVPEEELELGEGDGLMKVMHYASNYHGYQFHGVPFFVVVKKGDSLGDVKERIRKRLKVKKEGFNVWKLAMISEKRVPSLVSGSVEGFFFFFFFFFSSSSSCSLSFFFFLFLSFSFFLFLFSFFFFLFLSFSFFFLFLSFSFFFFLFFFLFFFFSSFLTLSLSYTQKTHHSTKLPPMVSLVLAFNIKKKKKVMAGKKRELPLKRSFLSFFFLLFFFFDLFFCFVFL